MSPNSMFGMTLVGGISLLAAIFGLANWHWLEQHHALAREGIAANAHVDHVTVSHKACNSSVGLSWVDGVGAKHAKTLMTCFANRSIGETIEIRYLRGDPDTAMLSDGQGGLPETHYRTGAFIGAIVAALMGAVTFRLALQRSRSR